MTTDFDGAYDTTYNQGVYKSEGYRGTIYYMPPEIFNRRCITFETDIWVVAAVKACITSGGC